MNTCRIAVTILFLSLLVGCTSILLADEGFYPPSKAHIRTGLVRSVVRITSAKKYDFSSKGPVPAYLDDEGYAVNWWPTVWQINHENCSKHHFAGYNYSDAACQALLSGNSLAKPIKVNYAATGIVVSANGVILTAGHVVEDCRLLFFKGKYPFYCPLLKVEMALANGTVEQYVGAKILYIGGLSSHNGTHPAKNLDFALIEIEASTPFVAKLAKPPGIGTKIEAIGFPITTHRPFQNRSHFGYNDADGSLRVSKGTVVPVLSSIEHALAEDGFDPLSYLLCDVDVVAGNSGGPAVINGEKIFGLIIRATEQGTPTDEANVNVKYIIGTGNPVWILRTDAICRTIHEAGLQEKVKACTLSRRPLRKYSF